MLSRILNRATERGIVKGIKVGKDSVEVSHLQLADGTILFFEHDNRSTNSYLVV